jgi:hypothetical protein
MERVLSKTLLLLGVAGLCFMAGLLVGRLDYPSPTTANATATPTPLFRFMFIRDGTLVQNNLVQDDTPERDPNDPRELIPLPGPGGGTEPPPGQGGAPQECGVYLYQDGQYYQLQPGQLPGGEGSPELIPLNPAPGGPGGNPGPAAPPPPPGIES